ncbi:hypothetical protein FHW67_001967 [Herbaspirillum sp. Sphag1AN]|uniref:hypothetical protein n=1 Tax=unclassified Herbaspirillum TaxID=2624150 RepID=UPI0016101018|nr:MULTISPECIES: hypothetical protein [unclassified Herbaspirillum]MBB3212684.1 hypothetical protein [Herbaspirillum sp. Sphag1AN]MBB3245881.1 hypothetical protein [Herbaspirillum sp. Sphag64]
MRTLYFLLLFTYSTATYAANVYMLEYYEPFFKTPDDACVYYRDVVLRTGLSGYKIVRTSQDLWCYVEYSRPGSFTGTILVTRTENDPWLATYRKRKKLCVANSTEKITLYVGLTNEQRKLEEEYSYPTSFNGCDIEVTKITDCWSFKNEIKNEPNRPTYCEFVVQYLGTNTPNNNADGQSSNSGNTGAYGRYERTETREDGSIETILVEENIIKNPDGSLRKITVETRTLRRPDGSTVVSPSTLTSKTIGDEKNHIDGGFDFSGGNTNDQNGTQSGDGANNNGASGGQSGGETNSNSSSGGQNGGGTNSNGSSSGQSGGGTNSNNSSSGQSGGGTNNNSSSGDQDGGGTNNHATDDQSDKDTNNKNPDLENLCKSNPHLTLCKESKITANCISFSCEGDAILCAMTRLQYENACRTQEDRTSLEKAPYTSLGDQLLAGRDPLQDRLPTPQNGKTISLGKLDNSGFLGSAQCLQDKNLVVAGQTIVIPLSGSCQYFLILRLVIMATASLVAMRIITGAVRR